MGTLSDGLILYDREAHTSQSFRHGIARPGTLASNNVRALAQTADGALWVATADGLCRFDGTQTFTCPGAGSSAAGGVGSITDDLYALRATPDGSLWAGGRAGLVHVDRDGTTSR